MASPAYERCSEPVNSTQGSESFDLRKFRSQTAASRPGNPRPVQTKWRARCSAHSHSASHAPRCEWYASACSPSRTPRANASSEETNRTFPACVSKISANTGTAPRVASRSAWQSSRKRALPFDVDSCPAGLGHPARKCLQCQPGPSSHELRTSRQQTPLPHLTNHPRGRRTICSMHGW